MGTALSLMVLAIIALVAGAIWLLKRGGSRKQAVLMLVLAVVLAANVAIWTLPGPQGTTLAREAAK
jgi:uncharacterized membrane protein YqjE